MRTPTLLNQASGQTGSSSTPPCPHPATKMSEPQRKGLIELTSGPCCAPLPLFQPPGPIRSPSDEGFGGLTDRHHVQAGPERSGCQFSQLPNQTSGSEVPSRRILRGCGIHTNNGASHLECCKPTSWPVSHFQAESWKPVSTENDLCYALPQVGSSQTLSVDARPSMQAWSYARLCLVRGRVGKWTFHRLRGLPPL